MRNRHPIERREFLRAAGMSAAGMVALQSKGTSLSSAVAPKNTPVKIGQIGTLHAHASGKMESLRKLSEWYEVVGIVEPDSVQRKSAESSAAYRGLKWMTEEELLNTPGLKAVAVETAVKDLLPTAGRCLTAGMHIHLDKPAGESLGGFRRLLEQASARRLVVQMGYMLRHNPAFRFCFQAVREGWLGKVFEVHAGMSRDYTVQAREPLLPYRGGAMFELGCHLIDALATVLGKPDAVTPYNRRIKPELDALFDNQLALFEYPQATATVRACLAEIEGARRRQFTVAGTEGTIAIQPLEPPTLVLTLDRPRGTFVKGRQEVALPKMTGRYDDHLIELARIIRVPAGLGRANAAYRPFLLQFVEALEIFTSSHPWQFFNFHDMWQA